jgi:hypothetical protein
MGNIQNNLQQEGCFVENAQTLSESANRPFFPATMKIPVVLAEPTLQVCVEADIVLEERALEIKRVLKDVILDQVKLVPTDLYYIFKLFVRGFIRKNIEYAAVDTVTGSTVCGGIRHTTVTIPFDSCTEINLFGRRLPIINVDSEQRVDFLDPATGTRPQLEKRQFKNVKWYNEQPYGELVTAQFNELDIGQDLVFENQFERSFQRLREKIVLTLTLKVLQVQQIPIPVQPPYVKAAEEGKAVQEGED